jgi:Transposase DDE domain
MGFLLQGKRGDPPTPEEEIPMDEKILAIYCLCANILQALGHTEEPQQKMSDAEVITPALVAMLCFRGNVEAARALLCAPWYMPDMLSRSRLNRRLHRLKDLLLNLFELLGPSWKQLNTECISILDSFPLAACDNYRIPRAKLYQPEVYRGYISSKTRYFYGLKVHLLVTKDGRPIECYLTPGSSSDVRVLKTLQLHLPAGRHIYADKAYNDDELEDVLREAAHIQLCPIRKKNSKRALPPYLAYVQHYYRKMIETVGSLIERLLPKTIHAVTAEGFELKVFLFILAFSLNYL